MTVQRYALIAKSKVDSVALLEVAATSGYALADTMPHLAKGH